MNESETNTITWKARFERKDTREEIHMQVILGRCLRRECKGTLSTSEVFVAYTEDGKNFVRTPQELWTTGVNLSCSDCDLRSPFEVVEALTIQAEATVKIIRGFRTFRSFNVN